MKTAPETTPPDPDDEARFIAFLKESAHTNAETPPSQITDWKAEILAAAIASAAIESRESRHRQSQIKLAPFPLRMAWAALWITAAAFHLITPEPPMSAPPVRRPTAATFQQLSRNGQNLRTMTPLVRFHTLKRELQLR